MRYTTLPVVAPKAAQTIYAATMDSPLAPIYLNEEVGRVRASMRELVERSARVQYLASALPSALQPRFRESVRAVMGEPWWSLVGRDFAPTLAEIMPIMIDYAQEVSKPTFYITSNARWVDIRRAVASQLETKLAEIGVANPEEYVADRWLASRWKKLAHFAPAENTIFFDRGSRTGWFNKHWAAAHRLEV